MVVCLANAPALRGPFIFDDVSSIETNPTIQRLWPLSVPLSPPANSTMAGRPLVNLTFAVNYTLNRALGIDQRPSPDGPLKTVSYHTFNIVIHLLNALLLFGIVRRTSRRQSYDASWHNVADELGLCVAALWALHPIQTEAINYVTQRTELLVALCYFETLYAWIRSRDALTTRHQWWWRAAAVAACLLGGESKEVIVTAPLLIALYDRAFSFESWKALAQDRRTVAWYAALALAVTPTVVGSVTGARHHTVGFGLGVPWYAYLYTQCWAIAHYLRLVAWPNRLALDYGVRPIHDLSGVGGGVLLVALLAGTLWCWAHAQRWGWAAFLGSAFFVILAPSSSVIPITTEMAAERRMYMPLAAVIVLVVVSAEVVRRRVGLSHQHSSRRAFMATVTVIGLAFAMVTVDRSRLYADPINLWRDAITKVPTNARGYGNLGKVLLAARPPQPAAAESLFRRAVELDSLDVEGWDALIAVVLDGHRDLEAKTLLTREVQLAPQHAQSLALLGDVTSRVDGSAESIPILERSAKLYPHAEAFVNLGVAYQRSGRATEAVQAFSVALSYDSLQAEALTNLGALLIDGGHSSEAIPYLRRASVVDTAPAWPYALLSQAYADVGDESSAAQAAARAVSLGEHGTDARVYQYAGFAMLDVGHGADAEQYLTRAMALAPNNERIITGLGHAKVLVGKKSEAIALYQHALAISPGFSPAREALARIR